MCRRASRSSSTRCCTAKVGLVFADTFSLSKEVATNKNCVPIPTQTVSAGGKCTMQDAITTKERWMELCELAAREVDPQKLISLVSEINRMLDEKLEAGLRQHQAEAGFSAG